MQKIFKKFIRLINSPLTSFSFYLLCVAIFLFIPPTGGAAFSFYFMLPFILFAVVGLNLSFFSSLFSGFTISEAKKCNHALEHGTIFFIRHQHGNKYQVGGLAEKNGFRICGVNKKDDIIKAFDQLRTELCNEKSDLIISMRCGSNIVSAQGLGLILLTMSAIILKFLASTPEIISLVL